MANSKGNFDPSLSDRGTNAVRPRLNKRPNAEFTTGVKEIDDLDLEPLLFKLHTEDAVASEWSLEKLYRAADHYKAFLAIHRKYPGKQIVPSTLIDSVWHQHILDTVKYAHDCSSIFGVFLHHFPYLGTRGEADVATLEEVGRQTFELMRDEFPELALEESMIAKSWFPGGCDVH